MGAGKTERGSNLGRVDPVPTAALTAKQLDHAAGNSLDANVIKLDDGRSHCAAFRSIWRRLPDVLPPRKESSASSRADDDGGDSSAPRCSFTARPSSRPRLRLPPPQWTATG